jgi:hypothetical protein
LIAVDKDSCPFAATAHAVPTRRASDNTDESRRENRFSIAFAAEKNSGIHGADPANPVASLLVHDNSRGTGFLPRLEIR